MSNGASIGMNAHTGKALSGTGHLMQSVRDILTTRIGTRLMRPDYGSRIPDLIDSGIHPDLFVEIYAAVAGALKKWEPRIKVKRVKVVEVGAGYTIIDIDAEHRVDGKPVTLAGVQL